MTESGSLLYTCIPLSKLAAKTLPLDIEIDEETTFTTVLLLMCRLLMFMLDEADWTVVRFELAASECCECFVLFITPDVFAAAVDDDDDELLAERRGKFSISMSMNGMYIDAIRLCFVFFHIIIGYLKVTILMTYLDS